MIPSNSQQTSNMHMQHGTLLTNKDTLNSLKQKHPEDKLAHESVLLRDTPEEIHTQ